MTLPPKNKVVNRFSDQRQEQRSLSEWLAYLELLHPSEIELGLDRIAAVAKTLKLTRPAKKVITIAGTNGKGSTVAITEALLGHKGRRVGAYTSPHLLQYNERVRIDGQPVDDETLCAAFAAIDRARGDISLSYFEFGTLAALLVFEQAELDFALLEVGLGGRLDAVNIVTSDLAIISSIAIDHQSWLGDSREQIAPEKAAIARSGRPVVCGEEDMPATLLPALKDIGARPYLLGSDEFCYCVDAEILTLNCSDSDGQLLTYDNLPLPEVPLPSALCAVQALLLLGESISGELLRRVFRETNLLGRLQALVCRGRNVIVDVAHNPASAQYLAKALQKRLKMEGPGEVHALFAVMADKDVAGIVAPLSERIKYWHVAALPGVGRAAEPGNLAAVIRGCVLSDVVLQTYPSVQKAMLVALAQMTPEDTLLGFGSFFTVAEMLRFIQADGGRNE